jgi:hypothetical protein
MLLPSETILWEGRPTAAPRPPIWRAASIGVGMLALIGALFAGVLFTSDLPGGSQMCFVTANLALIAIGIALAPSFLIDPCRYTITDRRVLWQRGRFKRSIDRKGVTFARIHWHPLRPSIGDLELVRAVPFGPLARTQRLVLHNVEHPGAVLAIVRGAEPEPRLGDGALPMAERLDEGERVIWGGNPEGWLLGWREVATATCGLIVIGVGLDYVQEAGAIMRAVESFGITSAAWYLLGLAMLVSAGLVFSVGGWLVWYGVWRARAMGRDTEYMLTDRRLLIRRGRTELWLDRRRIVDVAPTPSWSGVTNLYVILDAPEARALADSGALSVLPPSRDTVPPVLYELREADDVSALLLERISRIPRAA